MTMFSKFLIRNHEKMVENFNNQTLFKSTFKFRNNFNAGSDRMNYKATDVSRNGTNISIHVEMFTTTQTDVRIGISAVYLDNDEFFEKPFFTYDHYTGKGVRGEDRYGNLTSTPCCWLNGGNYDIMIVTMHNIYAKFEAFSLLEAANNSNRKGKVSIGVVETPGNKTLFSPEIKLIATTDDFINELNFDSANNVNSLPTNSSNKVLTSGRRY